MRENLKKYLQSLFLDAPKTAHNDALFEELLGNLSDRYDELIGEGLSPDAAYARAIGDLGDISPLIEKATEEQKEEPAAPTPPPFYKKEEEQEESEKGGKRHLPPAKLCTAKMLRGAGVAIGVMLYISWLVLAVMFNWIWPLFVFAALGTVLIVLTCSLVPDFADDSARTYAPAARKAFELAANLLQAFGIAFCILCILPAALINSSIGEALMFIIVSLGVGMLIFASAIRPRLDKELENKEKADGGQWYETHEKPKKKRRWLIPLIIICALLALLCIGVFTAETRNFRFGLSFYRRTDPALYTNVGDAVIEEEINRLSIEWDAGSVKIEPYGGDTVKIMETTKDGTVITDREEQLHWYVENGHLRIRFDGKGNFFFHWGRVTEKHLTVQIPMNSAPFAGLSLDVLSASVVLNNLSVYGNLDVESISGNTTLYAVWATSTDIETVSGNIITAGSNLGKLSIDTVSGVTTCRNLVATDIDFDAVSGDLSLKNSTFGTLDADTLSGDVTVTLATPAVSISFDTTSGDLHIKREGEFGFIAEFDSTSGDFETALSVNHSKGYYRYGDESMRIEMDSTSGDLTIE